MVAIPTEAVTGEGVHRSVDEGLEMVCTAFADRGFVRAYPRNAFIFLEGEPTTAAFAVKSGRVELLSISDSGREVGYSVRQPGEVFGITEVVLRHEARARSTRALEDSEIIVLPRGDFYALITERPEITLALLASALDRGVEQVALKRNLTGTPARLRVAASLDYLASRYSRSRAGVSPITVRVTHEQLSRLCGLTRQTVTSELDRFETEGVVELKSRHIVVHDRGALQVTREEKR
ncbi:MAG: Crp/Fnr family transcriptional regulator [Chloroflexi bacterium]|nr:Crp/Fnr family transcriptional regulator [Chloroflexota bacterium]